jgi:hypothetical protein
MMANHLQNRKTGDGILWLKFKFEDYISFLKIKNNSIEAMENYLFWMPLEKVKKEISSEEFIRVKEIIESKHITKGFSFVLYIYKSLDNLKDPFILKNDIIFIESLIKPKEFIIVTPEEKINGENDIRKFFSQEKNNLGIKTFPQELEEKKLKYIKTGKGFEHFLIVEDKNYRFVLQDWK